jgi:hypothetical protein
MVVAPAAAVAAADTDMVALAVLAGAAIAAVLQRSRELVGWRRAWNII